MIVVVMLRRGVDGASWPLSDDRVLIKLCFPTQKGVLIKHYSERHPIAMFIPCFNHIKEQLSDHIQSRSEYSAIEIYFVLVVVAIIQVWRLGQSWEFVWLKPETELESCAGLTSACGW